MEDALHFHANVEQDHDSENATSNSPNESYQCHAKTEKWCDKPAYGGDNKWCELSLVQARSILDLAQNGTKLPTVQE